MITKQYFNSFLLTLLLTAFTVINPPALANSHGKHTDMKGSSHHHGHGHGHGNGAEQGSAVQSVMGHGVINKVISKARMVTITHEPMKALNWPEMRMKFKVDEKVDLSVLEAGQQVEFMLDVMHGNNYLVTEIRPR